MTNAIETTKREMWKAIANVKGRIEINYSVKDVMRGVEEFEGLLEDHLEQLRQQYEQMAATAHDRFETVQSLEQANQELQRRNDNQYEAIRSSDNTAEEMTSRLERMTEERDAIRNKLQAFEFANKSSGEFLIDALRKVKSQRKTIKALRKAREARESVGATSVSSCGDVGADKPSSAPKQDLGGSFRAVDGVVYVAHQKFDGFTRTTCTACNRETENCHDQA